MTSCAKVTFTFPNRFKKNQTFLLPNNLGSLFSDNELVEITNSGTVPIYLEAEAYRTGKDTKFTDDGFLLIKPGQKFAIADPSSLNLYYLPGVYAIRCSDSEDYSTFQVTTNIADEQSLVDLVSVLESFQKNLSYNFLREDKREITAITKLLDEFQEKIKKASRNIAKSPDHKLKKEYHLSDKQGREDSKTARLNDRKRNSADGYYSYRKVFSYDTTYNRTLKFDIRKTISLLKRKISEYYNLSLVDSRFKPLIEKMRAILSYQVELLSSPFFKMVKDTYVEERNDIVTNADYKAFSKLKKRLNDSEAAPVSYQVKRTSVLYELYGFILLNEALTQCGFTLQEQDDITFLDFKEDMRPLTYKSSNMSIILKYDNTINSYQDQSSPSLVSINSHKNKPDYALEFYRDEEFITSIIIDMKYRKYHNVIPETPSSASPLDDMINDYIQFAFLTEKGDLIRGAVDSLYIVFPDDAEVPLNCKLGYYLGAYPTKDLATSKAVSLLVKKVKEIYSIN